MNDLAIKNQIKDLFNGFPEEADVRLDVDFNEKRLSPYIISILEKEKQNMNAGLPDFRIKYAIILDCFIEDDKDGKMFEDYKNRIDGILSEVTDRFNDIRSYFDYPVVAAFYNGGKQGLTQTSNQFVFDLDLIISE